MAILNYVIMEWYIEMNYEQVMDFGFKVSKHLHSY